jgi:hypothetical protein
VGLGAIDRAGVPLLNPWNREGWVSSEEVLQLCSYPVVGWQNAPPGIFGLCSIQVATFEPEVILLAVGWYLRFSLSYRDVEELLAERGLSVDHVTVWRWVQRYAPEIQRRLRTRLRRTNDSWRLDISLLVKALNVGLTEATGEGVGVTGSLVP